MKNYKNYKKACGRRRETNNQVCLALSIYYLSITDNHNRVVLKTILDMENSDYINASYIDVSKIIYLVIYNQTIHSRNRRYYVCIATLILLCRVMEEELYTLDHKVTSVP